MNLSSVARNSLVTSSAVALLLGISLGNASAAAVEKLPLTETNRDCDGLVIGSQEAGAYGSAKVHVVGSSTIAAKVQVRGGDPNAEYGVRLIQVPRGATDDCEDYRGPFGATLVTDAQGNATLQVREVVIAEASGVFVVLNKTDAAGTDFLTTAVSAL